MLGRDLQRTDARAVPLDEDHVGHSLAHADLTGAAQLVRPAQRTQGDDPVGIQAGPEMLRRRVIGEKEPGMGHDMGGGGHDDPLPRFPGLLGQGIHGGGLSTAAHQRHRPVAIHIQMQIVPKAHGLILRSGVRSGS